MNKLYIYLKGEEELGEIIEQIRKAREKELIIVVPENTKSLLNRANLEVFKRELESFNKKVYFDTDDRNLINILKSFKFDLFLNEFEEKKIVDIRPPKKKHISVSDVNLEDKKIFSKKDFGIEESKKFLPKFSFKFNFTKILFYSVILGLVGISVFFIFNLFQTKAEVILQVPFEDIKLDGIIITLSADELKPDYDKKVLPAKYDVITVTKSEFVTTTGKAVTTQDKTLQVVFLNYLEREVPLKLGTRVVYQDNVFRITEKVNLPPFVNDEPGKVVVSAVPDSIKSENLILTKGTVLDIPGLKNLRIEDGRLWTDVVKVNVESDYNYSSQSVDSSVSSEDITNLRVTLENSLKEAVRTKLSLTYAQDIYYFDPSLIKIDIGSLSHNVGDKTEKISAVGQARFEFLSVPQSDFEDFLKNILNKEIMKQNKNLSVENINYGKIEIYDGLDVKRKTMKIGLPFIKATLVPQLNLEAFKSDIAGKDINFVKSYFEKNPFIKKTVIKIFPQFRDILPNDINRIDIKLEK